MQIPYRYRSDGNVRNFFTASEFMQECGKSIPLAEVARLLREDTVFLNWIYRNSKNFDKETGMKLTEKTVPEWLRKFQKESSVPWEEVAKESFGEELYGQIDNILKELEREKAERQRILKEWQGQEAGQRKVKKIKEIDYTFCWCPPGTFMMGSPASENGRYDDETQHSVILTRGFWLLETPVTQQMWQSVMGNNPSNFKGDNLPVEQVSWDDCQEFIEKIQSFAPQDMKFTLPSEAQWEYACRAGTTEQYGGTGNLNDMGWYGANSGSKTHDVKTKAANAWGLYDMHGNVWEWCNDWYGDYPSGDVTDPMGPADGSLRVYRDKYVGDCRSAARLRNDPSGRSYYLGFRLALLSSTER